MGKLLTHGYIKSRQTLDSLKATPIQLNFKVQDQNTGIAPYFQAVIESELRQWAKARNIDLLNSGLKIYTTIDSRMQRHAEAAVMETMRAQQQKILISLEGTKSMDRR